MRKTIFDRLGDSSINYNDEMARIEKIFSIQPNHINTIPDYYFDNHSMEKIIDMVCFLKWKHRGTFLNINELRSALNINDLNFAEVKYTQDEMLLHFEFVLNMIYLMYIEIGSYIEEKHHLRKYTDVLKTNIETILEKINYEIIYFEEKEQIIIVAKNPAANKVAGVHKDVGQKVIEYNHFGLKGNLEAKKDILLSLGHKFEPLIPTLKSEGYSDLESNISFLLNNLNIRHNNKEDGKNKQEYTAIMDDDELEKWYDTTYDLLLLAILSYDYIEKKEDLKELKTHY